MSDRHTRPGCFLTVIPLLALGLALLLAAS